MKRHRAAPRCLWALLAAFAALSLLDMHCLVYAQQSVSLEREDGAVVSGEALESHAATTVLAMKTIQITRATVATTFETTRIAGKDIQGQEFHAHAAVGEIEQCRVGGDDAQCAEEPAQVLATENDEEDVGAESESERGQAHAPATAGEIEQCRVDGGQAQCAEEPALVLTTDEDGGGDEEHVSDSEFDRPARALPHSEALNEAARHLKELQDQVRVWLPQLKASVDRTIDEITSAWQSLVDKWRVLCKEAKAVYERFFADAVEFLAPIYFRIVEVCAELYAIVSSWVAVVVDHARTVWETHEEVRIVTRHVVSVLVLVCFGAVFFGVYALASTIPDTISTMWTGLDEITRAQLKMVSVLVTLFIIYHLRELWTFWLLAASIIVFYYWSGHVLAKTPSVQRQASRPSGLKLRSQWE